MVSVEDLLRIAAAGPDHLARLGELAARLASLDEERAKILAELSEYGIAAESPALMGRVLLEAGEKSLDPPQPAGPLCTVCGEASEVTVDDVEYCDAHGREALQARMR